MKIKLVSDLHIDYNRTTDFGFIDNLNKLDLLLIAGDIAGDYQNEAILLNKLSSLSIPVICVGGNHLGYNYLYRENRLTEPIDGTKEFSICYLQEKFKYSTNIHYLENNSVLCNGKVIYGGTMYTNFELYGSPELYKSAAERGLNDFRCVYTFNGTEGNIRPVTSDDYVKWFNYFILGLKKILEETKEDNLDVIVISHFAPSVKSISKKYNGGLYRNLNPVYASPLEEFIKDNSRIKLWVHGHMHDCSDYKIGGCRVVCEPYGYHTENYLLPSEYYGKNIILR